MDRNGSIVLLSWVSTGWPTDLLPLSDLDLVGFDILSKKTGDARGISSATLWSSTLVLLVEIAYFSNSYVLIISTPTGPFLAELPCKQEPCIWCEFHSRHDTVTKSPIRSPQPPNNTLLNYTILAHTTEYRAITPTNHPEILNPLPLNPTSRIYPLLTFQPALCHIQEGRPSSSPGFRD